MQVLLTSELADLKRAMEETKASVAKSAAIEESLRIELEAARKVLTSVQDDVSSY